MGKSHDHIFDIWDSKAKKCFKNLDQRGLAMHADLLIRGDCYLIHHTGHYAYNKREMRHGDTVRHLKTGETYVVAWHDGKYILRDNLGYSDLWQSCDYEITGNLIELR